MCSEKFFGLEFIADLSFRDQFEIPQPTEAYQEILATVPKLYVGSVVKLIPVVQV
jgi:uncharacterized protein (TIGR01615 family)